MDLTFSRAAFLNSNLFSAHAGAAPWEGINALDAAFLAYSGVSVLRQQTKPDHRVHGIIEGKDWTPNGAYLVSKYSTFSNRIIVIPDYAKMRWIVRAPTWPELVILQDRLTACLECVELVRLFVVWRLISFA